MNYNGAVNKAPLYAAPNFSGYRQFTEAPVPEGSGAMSAWTGVVQPFASDGSARRFLCVAAAEESLLVHEITPCSRRPIRFRTSIAPASVLA